MQDTASVKVLIVGADVATLTLALLLEKAGIDYLVLESSETLPVVAGGITLHPTVLPFLEQLNLRDDLLFFSQPMEEAHIQSADMDDIHSYNWSDRQVRYHAWSRFMSRPEYCNVIIEKLPESKILFNKTVATVTTLEDEAVKSEMKTECDPCEPQGVTVECADGSVYYGHLLVGDVNSGVERRLSSSGNTEPHRHHREDSKKDSPMREIHYHVSGITEAVDPQRIPLLREDTTELRLVLDNKNSLSWWVATLVDNRIAWQVTKRVQFSDKSSRVDLVPYQNEQEAMDSILNHVSQNMLCPIGSTMAQLVDWTPRSQISCKRWDDRRAPLRSHSSRVVLLGEACRKIVPVLGQAAEESILDALALSEALVDMPSTELHDIRQAFDRYNRERTIKRDAAIEEARSLDQVLNAKGLLRKMCRSAILSMTPKYLQEKKYDEKYSYRPQACFLERIPDWGQVRPNASSYSRRTMVGGVEREKY
ncbi:hypothetical protein B0O80DRAFT_447318 [Mortierella sp. GBAus27b]|nr:hypothetical protein B0O80DRAFT_447318 [Mortierella sp. GBAus27b]